MSKSTFFRLRSLLSSSDSPPLPSPSLAATIFRLALNASYKSLLLRFGFDSVPDVSRACFAVCKLMNEKLGKLDDPKPDYSPRLLPNCCGVLGFGRFEVDGKLLGSKGSLIVQALVDSNGRFSDISAGWPSTMKPEAIFRQTTLFSIAESDESRSFLIGAPCKLGDGGTSVPPYVLGDSSLPLLPWLVTRYHSCSANEEEDSLESSRREFNNVVHTELRNVEVAFAKVRARWRILDRKWKPETIEFLPFVVTTGCLLHNFLVSSGDDQLPEDWVNGVVAAGDGETWKDNKDDEEEMRPYEGEAYVGSKKIRDAIAENLSHTLAQLCIKENWKILLSLIMAEEDRERRLSPVKAAAIPRAFAVTMVVAAVTVQWLPYSWSFAEAYPTEDLVVSLPGQPKVGFRQFAGYVNIDSENGRSLFYYYVEADKQPETKPLTLWLNGGPGCSSVGGGAFTELGPFYPTGDGRGLRINSMSWNKASNLLFVESPAGVGWSYSNTSSDYNTGDKTAANDMLVFLLRWFIKFPELKFRDFFLTGESYAGHYIPQLADAIHSYNIRSSGFKFNVKGIAIGNPLLKLDTDTSAAYDFFWSHGMISDELRLTIGRQCDFASLLNLSKECMEALSEVSLVTEYVNVYDVLLDLCYPSIVEQELRLKEMATKMSMGVDVCMTFERQFYFNLPEVQHALHANHTRLPYEWAMCSNLVNYSGIDLSINVLPTLKKILQNNTPVWIFSGDQDSVIPLLSSRTLVRELANDLNFNTTVPYGFWFHKEQVGGWVTEYGKLLTFATVRGAAHMVPYAQPSRALHIFSSFVRGQRLPNKPHTSLHE
ncbi:unnamed protein product [Thlaspi arvense]|uniref:Carboxypeptidase n=1 Tax=Thlaspi arvense TaxID=13288 RepID=A0AAU9S791_THLAR|nr:unnamed protein product [Thlaspi arvense]